MSRRAGSQFEQLEPRQLFAVRTVDFDNYPVNFTQFSEAVQQLGLYWLVVNQRPPTR